MCLTQRGGLKKSGYLVRGSVFEERERVLLLLL